MATDHRWVRHSDRRWITDLVVCLVGGFGGATLFTLS